MAPLSLPQVGLWYTCRRAYPEKREDPQLGKKAEEYRRQLEGTSSSTPFVRMNHSAPTPTDYFPPHEFEKIIDATYAYRENRGQIGNTNSTRLRTMTLLMRWSGLRIRDAVTLERTRLHGDSLLLYQAKTGTPVYVPLPSHLVEALRSVPAGPKPNPRYFFWSGTFFFLGLRPSRRRSLERVRR